MVNSVYGNGRSWINNLKAEDFSPDEQEMYLLLSDWEGDFESWLDMVKKLISACVRKQTNFECGAFDISDLEVHGFEILLKVLDKFDPSKSSFEDYLNFHLWKCLPKEASRLRSAVSSGSDLNERKNRVMKCRKAFLSDYGVEPSFEELAGMCGYSVAQVRDAIDLYNQSNGVLSLNNLCDDSSNEYENLVEDYSERFEAVVEGIYSGEQMLKLINTVLTKEEADVIKWFYGFYDDEKHTEQEVADILGYHSRQNVHIIKKRAVEKLGKSFCHFTDSAA